MSGYRLPVGRVKLEAQAEGYAPQVANLTVKEGKDEPKPRLALRPTGAAQPASLEVSLRDLNRGWEETGGLTGAGGLPGTRATPFNDPPKQSPGRRHRHLMPDDRPHQDLPPVDRSGHA